MSDSVRPHRHQPTRLPCPWDSLGKNNGVGCHFILQCVKVKSFSCVRLLVTPWTTAYQAGPSMGFSRQEHWSGVPLPSPVYNAGGLNTLLSEGCVLEVTPSVGTVGGMYIPRTGKGINSSQLPLSTSRILSMTSNRYTVHLNLI